MLLFSVRPISAQRYHGVMTEQLSNSSVRMTLKEAGKGEPLPYASAYLVPKGDSTIVDFSLSDQNGRVVFRQIPMGRYILHIEMMGYESYQKDCHFRSRVEDLGSIELKVNTEYLNSATVSAAANPIRIMKDTIEFNASSFRVGQNAMLEDLLEKMPGMEIEDGKVKMNGEEVSKITVGGKTFFFNNSNAALKNLPARIVDKIKVIDRDKEEAAFSGVAGKEDREKILDVDLREEFKKGWFGNTKLAGGATLTPDRKEEYIEPTGMVYNANAMVSAYSDKDQGVLIANAYNVPDSDSGRRMAHMGKMSGKSSGQFSQLKGLTSSAMAGANYNTQRIKGMQTTASVNFMNTDKDGKEQSFRTSFLQDSPDLNTVSTYQGTGQENSLRLDLEMKNTRWDKYYFKLEPQLTYTLDHADVNQTSRTQASSDVKKEQKLDENGCNKNVMNINNSVLSSNNQLFKYGIKWNGGIRDLGKEKRSLRLRLNVSATDGMGYGSEYTLLKTNQKETLKDLHSNMERHSLSSSAQLHYVEPMTQKWLLETSVQTRYNQNHQVKDAYNPDDSRNDYYSTLSDTRYMNNIGRLLLQFSNDTLSFQLGGQAMATQNIIHSETSGQSVVTGKGDWNWKFSPFANLRFKRDCHRFYFYYSGVSSQVSGNKVLPIVNFTNPLQIHAGNIYLRPTFSHHAAADYAMNNRNTFTFVNADFSADLTSNGIIDAIWFDEAGVRYAVPVNSPKPQVGMASNVMFNQPFGPERRFTFSAHASVLYNSSIGYQALSALPGMDLESFDYGTFMDSFWGNPSGDLFYSGKSGFEESKMQSLTWRVRTSLKYSVDCLDLALSANVNNRISRYSLDSKADTDIWQYKFGGNVLWEIGREWELGTYLSYRFYRGYTDGYGLPEWQWNLRVSKSIQAFTISLKAVDVLNQTKNLRHVVANDYIEDAYTNVIGRHVLFSLSYNFGKRNGAINRRTEEAIRRMM